MALDLEVRTEAGLHISLLTFSHEKLMNLLKVESGEAVFSTFVKLLFDTIERL